MSGPSFLDLPAELRLMIYSHLLPTTLNPKPFDHDPTPYSLIATCRIIRSELEAEILRAIRQYLQETMFVSHDYPEGVTFADNQLPSTYTRHLNIRLPLSLVLSTQADSGVRKLFQDITPHFRTLAFTIYRDEGAAKLLKRERNPIDRTAMYIASTIREIVLGLRNRIQGMQLSSRPIREDLQEYGIYEVSLHWRGLMKPGEEVAFMSAGGCSRDVGRWLKDSTVDCAGIARDHYKETCLVRRDSTFISGKKWTLKNIQVRR